MTTRAARVLLYAAAGLTPLAVFVGSWAFAGPVAAIAYTMLYLVGAVLIPGSILLGAPSFPGSLRSLMGKLQWILAAAAYDVPFLVQHETGWQLHPGRTRTQDDAGGQPVYEVYLDGSWQEIVGGVENMTVLGWQPFGIVLAKPDGALRDMRADTVAERDRATVASSDGGLAQVERGGYQEVAQPGVQGDSGRWLVDLKRVYTAGVARMGDIAVIEKTEEIMTRKDAQEGAFAGWEPIIATAIGILLGVVTGYVMMAGG